MKHSLDFVSQFATKDLKTERLQKLRSIHFDRSGHVIATNSHVLFASKEPFILDRANKTYHCEDHNKEATIEFPEWRKVLPTKSARKVTLEIPKWFSELDKIEEKVTLVLDHSDLNNAFIRVAKTIDETSLAFNAKYLTHFAGQTVSILISSPLEPTIILSDKSKVDPHSAILSEDILNEEWFYLLMPIRLGEDDANSKVYL
jgi:hypothetical protein